MDLNTFGADLIKQLARIADAIESKSGAAVTNTISAQDTGAVAETAAATKVAPKRKAAAEKAPVAEKAPEKTASPKRDFAEVKAALIKVKDTIGKDAAQEVYRTYDYEAMSKIQPEHYDAVFNDAEAALAKFAEADAAGEALDEDDL